MIADRTHFSGSTRAWCRSKFLVAATLFALLGFANSSSAQGASAAGNTESAAPAKRIAKAAENAVSSGEIGKALTLYQGLAQLSQDAGETRLRLAEVLALAGQQDEAALEIERVITASENPDVRSKAKLQLERLRAAKTQGEMDTVLRAVPARDEAVQLFKVAQSLVKSRQYSSAIAFYEAAMLLDPDLPGPYRASGAVYSRLGDAQKKRTFFAQYLRLRPDGKTADEIRKQLASDHILGELAFEASFPCEIYVNGRRIGAGRNALTPLAGLTLPAGRYAVTLVHSRYHIVKNFRISVAAETKSTVRFDFGVVAFALSPWARVKLEGRDLGLWDEIGLPAGEHLLSLRAHDGSKTRDVRLHVAPGSRVTVDSWSGGK